MVCKPFDCFRSTFPLDLNLFSVFAICNTILFSIAAAGKGAVPLTDSGVHQAFYTALFPMAYVITVTYAELWVEYLPSQVRCVCGERVLDADVSTSCGA